jgi:hypothetical protein
MVGAANAVLLILPASFTNHTAVKKLATIIHVQAQSTSGATGMWLQKAPKSGRHWGKNIKQFLFSANLALKLMNNK